LNQERTVFLQECDILNLESGVIQQKCLKGAKKRTTLTLCHLALYRKSGKSLYGKV
jgi:hypothetical protein